MDEPVAVRPSVRAKIALPVIAVAGLLLLAPSLVAGPPAIDSAPLNDVWTRGFARALGEGVLYPRGLAGSFEGLGSPTFYFYPPFAFYLSGGLHLAGLPVGAAINGAGLIGLTASGAAMSETTGSPTATVHVAAWSVPATAPSTANVPG